MAVYKTYTCDICGVQGAKRFVIPFDRVDDKEIDGPVDLCLDHTEILVSAFLLEANLSLVQRKMIWKLARGMDK